MQQNTLEQPSVLYSTSFPAGTIVRHRTETYQQTVLVFENGSTREELRNYTRDFYEIELVADQSIFDQSPAKNHCIFSQVVFPKGTVLCYENKSDSIKHESDKTPKSIRLSAPVHFAGIAIPADCEVSFTAMASSLPADIFSGGIDFVLQSDWTRDGNTYAAKTRISLDFEKVSWMYFDPVTFEGKEGVLVDFKIYAEAKPQSKLAQQFLHLLAIDSVHALWANEQLANRYIQQGDKTTAATHLQRAINLAICDENKKKVAALDQLLGSLGLGLSAAEITQHQLWQQLCQHQWLLGKEMCNTLSQTLQNDVLTTWKKASEEMEETEEEWQATLDVMQQFIAQLPSCYLTANGSQIETRAFLLSFMSVELFDGRFDAKLQLDEDGCISIDAQGFVYSADGLWDEETAKPARLIATLKQGNSNTTLLWKANFYINYDGMNMSNESDKFVEFEAR